VVDQSGAKVQFFLPLQTEQHLLTCRETELYGRTMGTGITGDHQQWFDRFRVVVNGREQLLVGIKHNETEASAEDEVDVSAPKVTEKKGASNEQHRELKTLRIMVEGANMGKTGAVASDAALIAVWQDTVKRAGESLTETVQFSAGHTVLQIKSAVASKFVTKDVQNLYTHLDLRFVELKSDDCSAGILAEIWGLVPMSEATAKILQPPQ
jgi:hypothetical protein